MSLNRRNPKRDANEQTIIKVAERFGCSVAQLSGKDVPDLVIGFKHVITGQRQNILVEVKNEHNTLSEGQTKFHLGWRGAIYVVYSPHDLCHRLRQELGYTELWKRKKIQAQRRV